MSKTRKTPVHPASKHPARKSFILSGRAATRRRPRFEFGDFEFEPFDRWLMSHHGQFSHQLTTRGLDLFAEHCRGLKLHPLEVPPACLGYVVDTAYLVLLAMALKYAKAIDLLDGNTAAVSIPAIHMEVFERAKAMLKYHADRLPVRCNEVDGAAAEALLDKRAALVSAGFVPILFSGAKSPEGSVPALFANLPAPIERRWAKHKHRKEPLCHLIVASFRLAFRMLLPDGDERYWEALIQTFWPAWEDLVLDAEIVISTGELPVL